MQTSENAGSGETDSDSDKDEIPFISEQSDGLPPMFATTVIFNWTRNKKYK